MRNGYRGASLNFKIDSQVEQFNFNLKHTHLSFKLSWTANENLAAIERTEIYLNDGRLIKNVFIVSAKLAYYYEYESYYAEPDFRADVVVPVINICEYFDFTLEDVICVIANNNPQPAKFDLDFRKSFINGNNLDSQKSIRKNIFFRIEKWVQYPTYNEETDFLYHKDFHKG